MMRLASIAASLALLAGPLNAAGVPSTDGAFTLDAPEGWQAAEPSSPETVLDLRWGRAEFSVVLLNERLGPAALRGRFQADVRRLSRKGRRVRADGDIQSQAGVPCYLAGFGQRGAETHFGYFSIADRAYSFLAKRPSGAEVRAILATLAPPPSEPAQAPPAQAAQAPPEGGSQESEIRLAAGALTLSPVPGWSYGRDEGWVMAEGPQWSFALSASAIMEAAGSSTQDVQAMTSAYLAQNETRLVDENGCSAGELSGDTLKNGWELIYKPYTCPGGQPGAVQVVGVLLPRTAPLVGWLGEYRVSRQFADFRSWLSEGREEGTRASAFEGVKEEAPPKEDAQPRGNLAAYLLGAAVLTMVLIPGILLLRRRRRS
ncbi:MAG: hypothetical protein ABII00_19195 [Elusimicrobiota bacterium]